MEANKRKYYKEYTGTSYVEGNTVRKLNVVPDRREEQYDIPAPQRHVPKKPMVSPGISIGSLLVLTVAITATLFLCVNYIKVQSDINQLEKEIASKQETLITLTKINDAAYEEINTTYDLDYIYHVAVEEYGMVYPGNKAVVKYKGGEDDFVRQYEDIPK